MAFAMLAIWLSASAACVRDCASFEKHDVCCPSESGGQAPSPLEGGTSCVLSSAALTKAYDDEHGTFSVALSPVAFEALIVIPHCEPPSIPVSTRFADSLSVGWQFVTRAALPPRPPSAVS
jgi:hypothetical protein